MQYHNSAGVAQRLIQEESFREAVRTAFSGSQSADLLERCKALNACIQQVIQQCSCDSCIVALMSCCNKSQGRPPQPLQQEPSPTDSDICSQCSTSDSDIPDEEQEGGSKNAAVNEIGVHTNSCVRRWQPTLVQHAAATTIQRCFRHHLRRHPDRIRTLPDQIMSSTNQTAKIVEEADLQKQHDAASYIQAWWRLCSSKRLQLAAPLTPPCSSSNLQTSCNSMHSSRPGSASTSSQSGLSCTAGWISFTHLVSGVYSMYVDDQGHETHFFVVFSATGSACLAKP